VKLVHLSFRIHYHTAWGQQVCLCGSIPELGEFDESKAVVLSNDGDDWNAIVEVTNAQTIQYYYFIREKATTVRREWGANRTLHIATNVNCYLIKDRWINKPTHAYLYTSVFMGTVCRHANNPIQIEYYDHSRLLQLNCPYVLRNQDVCIVGDCEALGNWNPMGVKPLSRYGEANWQIVLNADELPAQCAYKFVIRDKKSGEIVHWEEGDNRILFSEMAHQKGVIVVDSALEYRYPNFHFKGTGTAIPVFSLRSKKSYGIGEFTDLYRMIDWVSLTGQQMIQLLPVNDTTSSGSWRDSYPYSAISIFALHPIYLGCSRLPLKDEKKAAKYAAEAAQLNSLPEIDYEQVLKLKTKYSRDLFLESGNEWLSSVGFQDFYKKNNEWLFPYACYCYLRDKNQTPDFRKWGEFSRYDSDRLQRMLGVYPEAKKEIDFWCFIQYLLHTQFSEVKDYAQENGVALKGDIPIGVNRNSVDAWTSPELFNMDTQTGAPPDDFSYFGQNWGFPTYNWQAMAENGFAWWISRFRKMSDYFDAYRIDHILGFFRIWEIPLRATQGLLGTFSPALPYSAEEISHAGIPFNADRMCEPFIHDDFLQEIFGEYTNEVKDIYLEQTGWLQYKLRPFCDTQQKISHLFVDLLNDKNRRIHDGLLMLCTEVLFIRDRINNKLYHPRITAQYTHSYKYLPDRMKDAFNCLYDDFFYRRHNYFWREQALQKLPILLSSTKMMACGEDLGMVPDCVPWVMHELQMLSLEIERMPKEAKYKFTPLEALPYLSVCTTSTHDMSPIRAWWKENRRVTQQYYNEVLHHEGVAPDVCSAQICSEILARHLQSTAMWVILPWQDWMSLDETLRNPDEMAERINVPANPTHYWCYRMHLYLEDLLMQTAFNEKVGSMKRT
jgi:4-alpha-glucanotransferase